MAWSMRLQRTFSGFASGWAGVALLALRVTVGASAGFDGWSVMTQPCANVVLLMAAAGAVIAGLAVTIGLLTPVACAILSLEGLVALFLHPESGVFTLLDSATASLQFVVISASLIALGPGAASVDARAFGRREVEIRRTQRSEDP
jgi:uncharacterized membrane protein YphA (DoxX/SURF4 family)